MIEDFERCYRAVQSRDPRFDGWFVTGVTSTHVYCRPSCPARTPDERNVRFFATAAGAQAAGFRACLRCRPDAAPGSPAWNGRADVVARAMRLIRDGIVDREGVAGLAAHLGYSERQLHRLMVGEVGTGPLALARAQRAQTARILVETTALPLATVAFAAGFSSVRQFNDTFREVFGRAPSALRARHHVGAGVVGSGALTLRLACRRPFDGASVLGFLGARALPGVESWDATTYRRSLRLPYGEGVVALVAGEGCVHATLHLTELRDLASAVSRCRRLLDLDADPEAVDDVLGRDRRLAPFVRRHPGRRVPGTVDGAELAVRAVIGQQVSVAGARTVAGKLVAALGETLAAAHPGITHLFPTPGALGAAAPTHFAMPASRREAIQSLAGALDGHVLQLDPGADPAEATARLLELPGIGPWTAGYVRLRALGDPDAFLPTDLGVRRALGGVGPEGAARAAERWRPWRGYAMAHLWARPDTPAASARQSRAKERAA